MKINLTKNRTVGEDLIPYVIAELGSNHNGNMELSKRMIDAAKESGADCVKFQSWSKETIFSRKSYDDNYFLADDYRDRNDYTMEEIVEEYSISEQELLEMKQYADSIGIDCTSTPFSKCEVDFLVDELKVEFIKIASMDVNNYPFISYIARKGKPIVISTGLSTLSEINRAIETIENAGNKNIVILHCVAIYPPEDNEINLRNIDTLSKIYPYPVGFSDHTLGTCVSIAAVAKGACMLEKHFTLDKEMEGWDHKISTTPDELKEIVTATKKVHAALGTGRIYQEENEERLKSFRRSIVAARKIRAGEKITEDMIDYKRPGTGLAPGSFEYVLGKTAKCDIPYDQIITQDDF